MELAASLHISGHATEEEGISLLSCNYSFTQDIDDRGLPKSQVRGGVIEMTFNSIEDEEIMWWMISSQADKSGKILFSRGDDTKAFKTLEFKDARCFYYQEYFMRDAEMVQQIRISARKMTLSGATHENIWTQYDDGD